MGDVLFIRQRGIAETSIQHPVLAEVPRPRRRSNRGLITTRLQRSRFPSGGTSRSMVRCRARRGWLAQPRGLRRRGSLVERSSSLNDPRIGDLLPLRKPWTHPKRGEDRQRVRVRGILIEDQTPALGRREPHERSAGRLREPAAGVGPAPEDELAYL